MFYRRGLVHVNIAVARMIIGLALIAAGLGILYLISRGREFDE